MEWKIGNVKIANQIVLAPMAGISNPAYMKICEEMGVGYAVTELISSEAIVRKNKKTLEMLEGYDDLNIPVGLQLFGSSEKVLAEAARYVFENYNFSIIDINMGCPVPKVALRSNAGSALLKDLKKIEKIVKAVVDSVDIPVTVKIRSGWDETCINALEVAKVIEKAGAKAICVHARTRKQGYSGKANWDIIKEVASNVKIPVIGNGDVKTPEDIKKMLDTTGCDAVMIGRGLLGNPWLIKNGIEYLEFGTYNCNISKKDKIDMCIKHLNYLKNSKSEKTAVLEIRNHIGWYLKGIPNINDVKNKIFKCNKIHDIILILNELGDEKK